jgi:hypothetical protein
MRHAIKLIQLAGEPLSIVHVHRAISSFPDHLGQQDELGWDEIPIRRRSSMPSAHARKL